MKILFVSPRFHTNLYQMVKTLQGNGHQVDFHVASVGYTEDHSLLTPLSVTQSNVSKLLERLIGKGGVNLPNYFPNPVAYWRLFKRLQADLVIIRDPFKIFSILVAFYSFFTQTRVVFYTQEELFRNRNWKTKFRQGFMMYLFRAAWMMPIKGERSNGTGKLKHMYFVPLPIPISLSLLDRPLTSPEYPTLLMVGKYHQERKNHILLINAVKALSVKLKFKLTIVGECTRESQVKKFSIIEEMVQNLDLTDIVELKKNVPFSGMEELYKTHDIFVSPASDEQYGVSITEALGYGLPAICTDTCGARFNIIDGVNGYVIKANSLAELTTVLEKALKSKESLKRMSDNALTYVKENLSGEVFYSHFIHLVNDRFQSKRISANAAVV